MVLPDLLVENPLEPTERVLASELLQQLAESLDRGTPWEEPLALAPALGISRSLVAHFGDELTSGVRAAAAAISDDRLGVSLVEVVLYTLLLPDAQRLGHSDELSQLGAALLTAKTSSQPQREARQREEAEELRDRGWALRTLPALPDPLAAPACTFTVGLSAFGTRPELVCAGPQATAMEAIEEVAPYVSEHDEAIAAASEVARLIGGSLPTKIRAVSRTLRLRIHCATYGPGSPRDISPVVEIAPV
jgi:hypothetical protein